MVIKRYSLSCSTKRTGQGRGVIGELDQHHVHVQLVADPDVQHTLIHVPVHGQRQRWRVGEVPQAENGSRHVHCESASTGHRLHGPGDRAHGRGRYVVGT